MTRRFPHGSDRSMNSSTVRVPQIQNPSDTTAPPDVPLGVSTSGERRDSSSDRSMNSSTDGMGDIEGFQRYNDEASSRRRSSGDKDMSLHPLLPHRSSSVSISDLLPNNCQENNVNRSSSINQDDMEAILRFQRKLFSEQSTKAYHNRNSHTSQSFSSNSSRSFNSTEFESFNMSMNSLISRTGRFIRKGVASRFTAVAFENSSMTMPQDEEEPYASINDLLSEGQHFLAMSMLVYIYAQLREMAVLGYTKVDFRNIDVNSYLPWPPENPPPSLIPSRSRGGSGLTKPQAANSYISGISGGSHDFLMSKSLLGEESSSTDFNLRANFSYETRGDYSNRRQAALTTPPPKYLKNTKTAGTIIRVVLDELEHEQNHYKDDDELLGFKREHDISIIKEFRTWVDDSRTNQLDTAAEQAIVELRRKVARARWKRAITVTLLVVRLKASLSQYNLTGEEISHSQNSQNPSSPPSPTTKRDMIRSTLISRREEMEKSSPTKANWYKLQRRLIEEQVGFSNDDNGPEQSFQDNENKIDDVTAASVRRSFGHETAASSDRSSKTAAQHVNKEMIDEVVEHSLPSLFRSGSVLSRMVESGVEVVWFGDRHPNEAIYCICVERKKKNIIVVFRGSVNSHNWLHNMKLMMTEQPNPLAVESYRGHADRFMIHTGFGLYLLRRRKDNNMRKIDEILKKVHSIGRELDPNCNYSVSITGHSLGGSLATILSLYMAADVRFTRMAPVRVFTFAAPRVGDERFRCAYRHLEETGRLLHARFCNTGDLVPLTSLFSVEGFRIGPWYKHVGLQVTLHGSATTLIKQSGFETEYPLKTGFWYELGRAMRMNLLMNLHLIGGVATNHSISAHHRRIHFARAYRQGLSHTDFYNDNRRKQLKTLEEYYQIRANIPYNAATAKRIDDTILKRQRLVMTYGLTLVSILAFIGILAVYYDHWVRPILGTMAAFNMQAIGSQSFWKTMVLDSSYCIPAIHRTSQTRNFLLEKMNIMGNTYGLKSNEPVASIMNGSSSTTVPPRRLDLVSWTAMEKTTPWGRSRNKPAFMSIRSKLAVMHCNHLHSGLQHGESVKVPLPERHNGAHDFIQSILLRNMRRMNAELAIKQWDINLFMRHNNEASIVAKAESIAALEKLLIQNKL